MSNQKDVPYLGCREQAVVLGALWELKKKGREDDDSDEGEGEKK